MKSWIRPRTAIALLAAIAAGLLVAMLPPLPDWTATLPAGSILREVSSDGRYLVSSIAPEEVPDAIGAIHVWDRAAGMEAPMIAVPLTREIRFNESLLSPDERTLALSTYALPEGVRREAYLFDLASGQKIGSWPLAHMQHWLFSREGKLLYVNVGVVREMDGDREMRRLPGGFKAGEFALYQDGEEVRIYSWLTGQEQARAKVPGNFMHVDAVSRDGRVLHAKGWAPGHSPWQQSDYQVLVDLSANTVRASNDRRRGEFQALSPDGQYVVSSAPTRPPAWLDKWWPVKDGDRTLHVTHWTTDVEVAQFRNIQQVVFAPQGNQLVMMRDNGVVEGYAFPLRKPWGLLAGAAIFAAGAVLSVAWLWTRWRARTSEPERQARVADAPRSALGL